MQISVNNDLHELPESCNLSQLLIDLGYTEQSFAVAINETFVPKSAYDQTMIQAQDQVEIVSPMQGG